MNETKPITLNELKTLLTSKSCALRIIDIRSADEYNNGFENIYYLEGGTLGWFVE